MIRILGNLSFNTPYFRPFRPFTTTTMAATNKLTQLRAQMIKHNLAAYFIPSEDAHQVGCGKICFLLILYRVSTFLTMTQEEPLLAISLVQLVSFRKHDIMKMTQLPSFLGFAIVTLQKAALWTDGRYFLQANQQLDSASWTLMKAGLSETPTKEAWLASELKKGECVGVDPALISFEAAKKFREQLEKTGQSLVAVEENLVDAVWSQQQQPPQPCNPIEHLPVEFSGRSSAAKIEEIRKQLQKAQQSALVVTALDEIACTRINFSRSLLMRVFV